LTRAPSRLGVRRRLRGSYATGWESWRGLCADGSSHAATKDNVHAVLGLRCRDEIGSSGRRHHDVRAWLRASYLAMLGVLDSRTAVDVHSREDTHPNSAGRTNPISVGGAGSNGGAERRNTYGAHRSNAGEAD